MTPEIHRRGGVDESMHSIFIRTFIWTCQHTIAPTLQGKVSSLHPWTAPGVSHSPEPRLVSKVQPISENRCDFIMHIVVVVVVVRISHFPFIFFLPWRLRLLLGREYLFPLRTGNSLRLCYLYYHYRAIFNLMQMMISYILLTLLTNQCILQAALLYQLHDYMYNCPSR